MKFMLRFVPFFVVLGVMGVMLAMPVVGQSTEDTRVYLPLVAQQRTYSPSLSIYGRASGYNTGASIILTLHFFDGITTTSLLTTVTEDSYPNEYAFLNLPVLSTGESYQVSYYNGQFGNSDNFRHLKIWHSFPITETTEGLVSGGDFRVTNLPLLFPSDQRQVQSPFTFEWEKRWGYTSSDNFVLNFYDMNETPLYSTPNLGYTLFHEFNPLSAGLALNTPYLWDVRVSKPDGSIGISREPKREVTFIEQTSIDAPTGLTAECTGGSEYSFCRFNWQPVEGANGYYIDADYNIRGWTGATSAEGLVVCGGDTRIWRVKARSDTEEGRFTEATYTLGYCVPPCSPCMREIFKEQAVWQPDRREPY